MLVGDSPLTLLALRCSPALWPLGSLALVLGYGQRSIVGDSSRTTSMRFDCASSVFGIGPLPCPAPSDAIQAPRPSFRRSSMPAVPSASSSFRVASGDGLSAPNRGTHPAKTLRQLPADALQFQPSRQDDASTCLKHPTLEHLPRFRRTCRSFTSVTFTVRRFQSEQN